MGKARKRGRGRPKGTQVLYRQIADDLRERMLTGRLKPDAPLPAVRTLAEEYGVGRTTLLKALQLLKWEGRAASTPNRRIVPRDAEIPVPEGQVTYLQLFPMFVSGAVGQLHFDAIQRGILSEFGNSAPALLTTGHLRYRERLPPPLLDLPLSGILLMERFTPAVYRHCERLKIPVVLVDRPSEKFKLHASCVDNRGSFFEATSRLIALGHRRIAFARMVLTGVRNVDPDSKERELGYRRALTKAGIKADRGLIFNTFGSDKPDSPSIQAVFQARSPATAILAVDKIRAGLLEKAARARGLRIPQDISLVAPCGKEDRDVRYSGPTFGFYELGKNAVRLLRRGKTPPTTVRAGVGWHDAGTVGETGR